MAVKNSPNGAAQLKNDLQSGDFQSLYLIVGEEDYLKRYYLDELKKAIVDKSFAEFNLIELEGKGLTPEALTEAVEGCPAFAEHKLVIVSDFDLYKSPAAFQNILPALLSDLPAYTCLVFYYDTLPFKPDKRTKIHTLLEKQGCCAEFTHLEERELIAWIKRRVKALGKTIDNDTCAYLIFLCGNSMINLITEIEKAAAHSTLGEIKKYSIDSVCTRVLDAVIFDLTDAITVGRFDRAIAIVNDLVAQKNTEVAIFTAVLRHIQRLYAVKLSAQSRGNSKELLKLIGSGSSYYAQKLSNSARKLSLDWLRECVRICAETDAALKSSAADKQKILELALLKMAAAIGDTI